MKTSTKTECTIKPLTQEYFRQTLDLFIKTFCNTEPVTKYLGISYAEYEPFATEVLNKAIKEGFSKVAIDQNNRVVACVLAEDLADPFVPKLSRYPKMKPVFELIESLSQPFYKGKTLIKGKILHVWIALVEPHVRGQGISTLIERATCDQAARKGYDFAYAEFTNPLTERIVNTFSMYQLINKINFKEFTNSEGKKAFMDLPGYASAYVAVNRPGLNFDSLKNCFTTKK